MRSHRDLTAYQVSWQLALRVQRWTEANWTPARSPICDQLRRAALSVPLNIAEGHAYGRSARCRHHFRIAYGSAVETAALLEFLVTLGAPIDDMPGTGKRVCELTFRLWQRTPT